MQRIGFFAGVLYHHTLFTSTPQRSVSWCGALRCLLC